jgi:hypothetical protein
MKFGLIRGPDFASQSHLRRKRGAGSPHPPSAPAFSATPHTDSIVWDYASGQAHNAQRKLDIKDSTVNHSKFNSDGSDNHDHCRYLNPDPLEMKRHHERHPCLSACERPCRTAWAGMDIASARRMLASAISCCPFRADTQSAA